MLIETDDYVTLKEAAELLGITTSTLSVQILRGNLAAIKPWGNYLIPRAAVAEYKARTQPCGFPRGGRPRKGGAGSASAVATAMQNVG